MLASCAPSLSGVPIADVCIRDRLRCERTARNTCTMQKDGRLGGVWMLSLDCMSAEMPACKAEFDSCVELCGEYAEDPDIPDCS